MTRGAVGTRWRRRGARTALLAGGVLALGTVAPGLATGAPTLQDGCVRGENRTVACTYGPGTATFTVPPGAGALTLTARGAAGGAGGNLATDATGGSGGPGAVTTSSTSPAVGTTLTVRVGGLGARGANSTNSGNPAAAGGLGGTGSGDGGDGAGGRTGVVGDFATVSGAGGGGGGGGSAVLVGSSPLLVAGGGAGGGGAGNQQASGGAGGEADGAGGAGARAAGSVGQPGAAPGPDGGNGAGGVANSASGGGGGGGGGIAGGSGGATGTRADGGSAGGPGGGGGSSNGTRTGTNAGPGQVVISYVEALAAGTVTAESGDGQSAQAGTAFAAPLVARVSDTLEPTTPVPGVPVTFTVTGGGATFPGGGATAEATTGENGLASAPTLTAGPDAGPVTVTASAPGTAGTATFTLTATAAPAPAGTRVAGSVQFRAGNQTVSFTVDARGDARSAGGRCAVAGAGIVAQCTSITGVVRGTGADANSATVTGTARAADGRPAAFRATVVDGANPDGAGRDRVSLTIGTRTLSGTVVNGNLTVR